MKDMQVDPLPVSTTDGLRLVLDEEVECWRRRLHWDYQPAAQLIYTYVLSQSLRGFVLRDDRGSIIGYAYYVIDFPVGYIGNVFVMASRASPDAYRCLLKPLFRALHGRAGLQRIECQLFPFNCDLSETFLESEFQALGRQFMVRELDPVEAGDLVAEETPESPFQLRTWNSDYLDEAASVVFDSYQGAPDFKLCRDYQSEQGCIRFLRNLMEGPGCGKFIPYSSLVALATDGRIAGVLITSEIGPGSGMIPQISMRREFQGQGLGSRLIRSYLGLAAGRGLKRTALSVSAANRGAMRLYHRFGFRTGVDFHAFVWEAPPGA